MLKQLWKFVRGLLTVLVALGVLTLIVPRLITTIHSMSRIYNVANAPQERAAIVFGAGLSRSGRPTPILRDRVQTAANLYFTVTGDTRFVPLRELSEFQGLIEQYKPPPK